MKKRIFTISVFVIVLFLICVVCIFFVFNLPDTTAVKKNDDSMYRFFLANSELLDEAKKHKAFTQYLGKFSEQEKIAQLFIVNIDGSTEFTKTNDYNQGVAPGAYLFFSFNIASSPSSIIAFSDSVYEYYINSIPPYLAVDHEGGSVNRLRSVMSPLPSPLSVSSHCSVYEAYALYENAASQLRLLGFNFNLAPVAEPLLESNKVFLQDRSFGSIENTIMYSSFMIRAFNEHNIMCALKHFPGNTNDDPHLGLPNIEVSESQFQLLINPFYEILQNPVLHTSVLLSHAVIPSITGNVPACFSEELTTGILKNNIGFDGLILTDDIFMSAIQDHGYDQFAAVDQALSAGAHMIMSSQKRFIHLVTYLEEKIKENDVLRSKISDSFYKIIETKIDADLLRYHKVSSYDTFTLLPPISEYILVNSTSKYYSDHRERLFNLIKQEGLELYEAFFTKE